MWLIIQDYICRLRITVLVCNFFQRFYLEFNYGWLKYWNQKLEMVEKKLKWDPQDINIRGDWISILSFGRIENTAREK